MRSALKESDFFHLDLEKYTRSQIIIVKRFVAGIIHVNPVQRILAFHFQSQHSNRVRTLYSILIYLQSFALFLLRLFNSDTIRGTIASGP